MRSTILVLVALLATASLASALHAPAAPTLPPSDPIAGKSVGQLNNEGMADPVFAARVAHFLAEHGLDHPRRGDLHGQTPIQAAQTILTTEQRDGRTPTQWLQLAKAASLLSIRASAPARGDLAADVARLDADAGAPLTSYQKAELQRSVDALPANARAALGDLAHAIALAWEAQAPIAAREVAIAHAPRVGATDLVLSDADRETTLANALDIIAAENAFRDAAAGIQWPQTSGPLFKDPLGLVILGSTGNDDYERTSALRDPILIVDPLGDDTYHTSAGGACPDPLSVLFDCNGLVVSVVLDLAGNDTYAYHGTPSEVQGSGGVGGIGILTDITGDDHYSSDFVRSRPNVGGYYLDAGSQGNGFAGAGILLDATGNDVYEASVTDSTSDAGIWDMSQGFGNVGGVGVFSDGAGDNHLLNYGYNGGCGGCFQGMYNGGTGFYGGVGVLSSTGLGNSNYHGYDNATSTDMYAWGFAAFGGTGIFYDDGGNDDYAAAQDSTANVVEIPLLNCAFGTSSYAGLGIFLDAGGNDQYYSDTSSNTAVYTQSEGFGGPLEGEGLFVDVSGDDGHFMMAHPDHGPNSQYTTGRGVTLHGGEGATGNTFGIYLDLGGNDRYLGAVPSQDNAVWGMGADINAGQAPKFVNGL